MRNIPKEWIQLNWAKIAKDFKWRLSLVSCSIIILFRYLCHFGLNSVLIIKFWSHNWTQLDSINYYLNSSSVQCTVHKAPANTHLIECISLSKLFVFKYRYPVGFIINKIIIFVFVSFPFSFYYHLFFWKTFHDDNECLCKTIGATWFVTICSPLETKKNDNRNSYCLFESLPFTGWYF